jgi:hypothetical protein
MLSAVNDECNVMIRVSKVGIITIDAVSLLNCVSPFLFLCSVSVSRVSLGRMSRRLLRSSYDAIMNFYMMCAEKCAIK